MRFHAFLSRYEMSLYSFRTRSPDEMSCLLGPLRALRMRLHACLAVMRFLEEITCFLPAAFSF
jgi:hypothetical protein